MSNPGKVTINSRGDVIVNGVRSPLRLQGDRISFVIKDRRMAALLGSREVSIPVNNFVKALQRARKGE